MPFLYGWTFFWCCNTLNSLNWSKKKLAINLEKNQLKLHLKCWSRKDFDICLVRTTKTEARRCKLRKMKFEPLADFRLCIRQPNTWGLMRSCLEINFNYPSVKGSTTKNRSLKLMGWCDKVWQVFGRKFGF